MSGRDRLREMDDRRYAAPASDPEDAITLGAIPDYPVSSLPEAGKELVCFGQGAGLPEALVGGAEVTALATAIGAEAEIEIGPNWRQRASLWIPLVAPRGAGKSPSQGLGFDPLRIHNAQLEQRQDDAGEEADTDTTQGILLGDLTLEALARSLHAARGGAGLDIDELSMLLRGLDQYKHGRGSDRGRLLSLWTGDPWSYTRVGSGTKRNGVRLFINRPTLTICGGLQPELHELLGAEADGLRPRWLLHLAAMPDSLGTVPHERAPGAWRALIDELLARRGDPRSWQFSPEARRAFGGHRETWKRQARSLVSASVAAALGKADNHAARIALVLAEAERPGAGGTVGSDLVERAAQIVNFSIGCWAALPEQGGLAISRRAEILDGGVDRLAAWLEEHGGQATRRDLLRSHVAGVRTAGDLEQLLERYQETYPGSMTTVNPGQGGTETTIVGAPKRARSVFGVATGDTELRAVQKAYKHGRFGGVATGDTESGDTDLATPIWGPSRPSPQQPDPGDDPPLCERHRDRQWRRAEGGPWVCGVCHPPVDGLGVEWREL